MHLLLWIGCNQELMKNAELLSAILLSALFGLDWHSVAFCCSITWGGVGESASGGEAYEVLTDHL